jgi:uncharacterized protein YecE (DUF72 family)
VPVLVGTSGWQYRWWSERFYPQGLRQADWLEFYAARFGTVEVNNAFYRLPEASTFAAWARRTPDDFVVAVKASRYLTHVKRLATPAEPVTRLLERAAHLGPKLGPVLLQLPPTLAADPARLDETLAAFAAARPGVRVAVEFRHPTWFDSGTRSLLEARGAALCLVDGPRLDTPVWRTAPWGYVRFHEGDGRPRPCYRRERLARWAERLAEQWAGDEDVYVYFNNDGSGCAVRDAVRFAAAVARCGRPVTRVPEDGEVHVG